MRCRYDEFRCAKTKHALPHFFNRANDILCYNRRVESEYTVTFWTISANDDWKSAGIAFRGRDYVKALFWGHLYLEKLLKAVIVKQTGKHAPYGHALPDLAKKAKLELTKDQIEFLKRVTDYNIKARYPDHEFELKKRATRAFTQSEINEMEKFGKWLKSILE